MDIWLLRVLNRIRPRDGWVVFVLTWLALLCIAVGVQEARWVPEDEFRLFFAGVTVGGGLVGLLLVRLHLTGWVTSAVGSVGGAAFVVNAVGRVLPPQAQLISEINYAGQWLRQGVSGERWGQIPFQSLLANSWGRLTFLGGRLGEWWTVVRAGEMSQDNAPFLLLAGLAFWAAAVLAMWGIYRWRQPLIGLLPGGMILVASLYHSGEGLLHLLGFLACGTFLVPWVRFIALVQSWEQRGVDYSPEVRLEVAFLGLVLAGTVVLGGFVMPSIGIVPVARWVLEHWPESWKSTDEGVWRVFGGIRRPHSPERGGIPVGFAGLPRAHLLSGSVDLTRRPVMTVVTDDPLVFDPDTWNREEIYRAPQYYWRALTYERYTGRGWENQTLEEVRYDAGQSLPETGTEGRRELRQIFSLLVSGNRVAYAAGDPLWLDVPYRARWRAPGDLAGLERRAQEYTVLSLVPDVSERALRDAPVDYPAEIAERYLQLPEDVPQRVLDLAHAVTADAPTPYDKALALQIYLRQFDYSLELDPPPPGQDVVDYFLFDVQTGYCDYYASSMVVMARAVGLPARLATGYAPGTYDLSRRHYYVVEADAHSWPEVYLSGYGWIEFEPTAAQSPFEREGAEPFPELPALPPPPRSPARGRPMGRQVLTGVGVLLAGLALALARARWPRLGRMSGPAMMDAIYRRLARHGARFGVPLRLSDTSGEFSRRLAPAIARRAARPRWQRWPLADRAQRATACLITLERTYLKATYSPYPLTEAERRAALRDWRGLAFWLWLIWLGGKTVVHDGTQTQ